MATTQIIVVILSPIIGYLVSNVHLELHSNEILMQLPSVGVFWPVLLGLLLIGLSYILLAWVDFPQSQGILYSSVRATANGDPDYWVLLNLQVCEAHSICLGVHCGECVSAWTWGCWFGHVRHLTLRHRPAVLPRTHHHHHGNPSLAGSTLPSPFPPLPSRPPICPYLPSPYAHTLYNESKATL